MRSVKLRYMEWMYDLVYYPTYIKNMSYRKLFNYLQSIDFVYDIPMDENRADDGIRLRIRFGDECHVPKDRLYFEFGSKPCSVLEMMIALSLRCEEHIMYDPDKGDRTGKWFWEMIANLGLHKMNDSNFNEEITLDIIERFMYRQYDDDGKGNIFIIKNKTKDIKDAEIWHQMNWYLNELFDDEKYII